MECDLRHVEHTGIGEDDAPVELEVIEDAEGEMIRRADEALVLPRAPLRRRAALNEQAAALAGLAPFDKDSGTLKGKRQNVGGRGRLRKSHYASAMPAANFWNKELKELY